MESMLPNLYLTAMCSHRQDLQAFARVPFVTTWSLPAEIKPESGRPHWERRYGRRVPIHPRVPFGVVAYGSAGEHAAGDRSTDK